jgi:predicted adenylyl cyclase CyaB
MTTNPSHVEVELRGLLPYSYHAELIKRLLAGGNLIDKDEEENIYYKNTGLRDLRLRRTASKVTLTAKAGDTADTAREEIEVILASPAEFEKAAALLKILGYETVGGKQLRSRESYNYQQATVTIDFYPDFHAYGFELERLVASSQEVQAAQADLTKIASSLGVTTYSKEIFSGVMQLIQSIFEARVSIPEFIIASQERLKEIVPDANPTILEALEEIRSELTRG